MSSSHQPFHIMAKPSGSACNLDCAYCFYLEKESLYPGSTFRMSDSILESYVQQVIEAHPGPDVEFAWQGGEPTLMGLDFYRKAIVYQQKYRKPGSRIHNVIQTNGVLLNDDWGRFLKKHNFLVGISIDGPPELHDRYRRRVNDTGSSKQVIRGLNVLKRHGVDFNILCTVHAGNQEYPLDVYRFFRDECGAQFIQFIPIVSYDSSKQAIDEHSVSPVKYGQFLVEIFDDWVRHDVARVFVQIFDECLSIWHTGRSQLCIFASICGSAMILEHTGDVYSCDHFVEPQHLLGNIVDVPLCSLAASPQQQDFGRAKLDTLPHYCLQCEVRFVCNGGCPKNRFDMTPDGQPGLNYLCAGYRLFFTHVDQAMKFMSYELRHQRPPANVMRWVAAHDQKRQMAFADVGRNDPCPCGSGQKFKHCHGARS